jgi:hypothetical protein
MAMNALDIFGKLHDKTKADRKTLIVVSSLAGGGGILAV